MVIGQNNTHTNVAFRLYILLPSNFLKCKENIPASKHSITLPGNIKVIKINKTTIFNIFLVPSLLAMDEWLFIMYLQALSSTFRHSVKRCCDLIHTGNFIASIITLGFTLCSLSEQTYLSFSVL